jgi:hypothetical protein
MPPKRMGLPIPALPTKIIQKAEHCARLIWNGKSFLNGREHTSDAEFMEKFTKPVNNFLFGTYQSINFDPMAIHDLVVVAGLKPLFRSWHEIDIRQFEVFLENNATALITGPNGAVEMGDFVKEAGRSLVSSQYQGKAGYRVALASRILFFAFPKIGFFNFSNDLVEALHLQTRPQAAIENFHIIMEKGLLQNAVQLNGLPTPTLDPMLDPIVYQGAILNGDWWQRRVLDLALKIHFSKISPLSPLPPRPI